MDAWLTKRCKHCYAVVILRGGMLSTYPAPEPYSKVECTQEQFDSNTCPACGRDNLMVVY